MNILIYGSTRIGKTVATELYRDHDITLMDEPSHLPDGFNHLDIRYICGNGTDIKALKDAGISKIDLFIACSDLDEANMVACWTIKKIVNVETICFIRRADLFHNINSPSHTAYHTPYDIDTLIWPEQLLTQDIFRTISVPEAYEVEYFAGGRIKLLEYKITNDSPICNKRISDFPFPAEVLVIGIIRDHILSISDGNTIIQDGDKVVFMGKSSGVDRLAALLFETSNPIKTATVIGGGNVGYMLAVLLEQSHIRVKIIEANPERCLFLADTLASSLVLQGDGTDLELLETETVGDADVTICVTNNDEKNLLCGLLAKQLGSKRIITRVGNIRNAELFERVGIDVVVSPQDSALKELLNKLQKPDVNILARIERGQGEILQITLPESFKEKKLMDLKLPAKAIVGVIEHDHKLTIPNGQSIIRAGNKLKVFAMVDDAESIKSFLLK